MRAVSMSWLENMVPKILGFKFLTIYTLQSSRCFCWRRWWLYRWLVAWRSW